MKMIVNRITEEQEVLLSDFADKSDILFNLGVITTDSFTGEIGEYIACRIFNLNKCQKVNRAVDAICQKGNKYQIKAKVVDKNYCFHIKKLETHLFDYLIIIYFDNLYNPLKVIKIPSNQINGNEVRITGSNINTFNNINISNLVLKPVIKNSINRFAKSYNALISEGIVRSRRIVGDIGEYYASRRLNLKLCDNRNEKGIDAIHPNGLTFEIKSRRVYSSARRKSETRRIHNLVGKTADFLIIVTLDRTFRCSGMWLMPTRNIINPKSANLFIINHTPGVQNLIKSKIEWLQNGVTFDGFKSQIKGPPKKAIPKLKSRNNTVMDIHKGYQLPQLYKPLYDTKQNSGCLVFLFIITFLISILI